MARILEPDFAHIFCNKLSAYCEHTQSLREWCQSEYVNLHAQHLGIWYLALGYLGCALKIS